MLTLKGSLHRDFNKTFKLLNSPLYRGSYRTYTGDVQMHTPVNNIEQGLLEYINKQPIERLYVTPYGLFNHIKDITELTGVHRRTLFRMFRDKRYHYREWYIIREDTPLQPDELCKYCDMIDDLLFAENCWMVCTSHNHTETFDSYTYKDVTILYLYKGTE